LLGHVDQAHAALADLLQQLVGADQSAGGSGDRFEQSRFVDPHRTAIKQASSRFVGLQELGNLLTDGRVAVAGLVEIRLPLVRRTALDGTQENLPEFFKAHTHGRCSRIRASTHSAEKTRGASQIRGIFWQAAIYPLVGSPSPDNWQRSQARAKDIWR